MKFRELIKLIQQDGWKLHNTTGSHQQHKHPTKPGHVTIAGKPGKTCQKAHTRVF